MTKFKGFVIFFKQDVIDTLIDIKKIAPNLKEAIEEDLNVLASRMQII